MIARFNRWLAVRIVMWGLNRGLSPDDAYMSLSRAYARHDHAWLELVVTDAQCRLMDRRMIHGR